ncbi:MAG TPA: hypothetical protein VGT98_10185 [Candidatus Elarobacter sp.]|nr:hypothetical protein [Candidatus Elarobacter sp.]
MKRGGDWTCSLAHFTGHTTRPMQEPDGEEILPTGKAFDVDFCTVAHGDEREGEAPTKSDC